MNRPYSPNQSSFWSPDFTPAPPVTIFDRPSMASTLTQAWRITYHIFRRDPVRGRRLMRLLIELATVADALE